MHKVILWRLAQFPLILAVIYLLTFVLVWIAPGDPFSGANEKNMDPIVKEALKQRFHATSAWHFVRRHESGKDHVFLQTQFARFVFKLRPPFAIADEQEFNSRIAPDQFGCDAE